MIGMGFREDQSRYGSRRNPRAGTDSTPNPHQRLKPLTPSPRRTSLDTIQTGKLGLTEAGEFSTA